MTLEKKDIETFAKKFAETIYSEIYPSIPYVNMTHLIQVFIDKLINNLTENFSDIFENNFNLSRGFEDCLIESFENILREKLDIKVNLSIKNEGQEKPRLWCTKCDVDLIKKGIALDCPEDGIFYQCPSCNYRIVIFKKGAE